MNIMNILAGVLIGAQVFVEPGQTPEQIDSYFQTLEDNGMKVARVRMFGSHMHKGAGWDFSLYDTAFAAAQKHGIRLFATLFPETDELNDVGGFKFPRSKAHLAEIDEYIRNVAGHFKDAPALDTWVLQNEPGTEGTEVDMNDLSEPLYREWLAGHPHHGGDGYLRADFRRQEFLAWYTGWFLKHISDIVRSIDPIHGRHVNPHNITVTLPEYDFAFYRQFLSSLGCSLHLSWHFGLFSEDEYPFGVSMMEDIIRSAAGNLPWWVTELQGGNVIASGRVPYCPTAAHTEQYLWESVAAGTQGIIFWTLNQRHSVREAGEWGMIDYQGEPSDRLLAAGNVAGVLKENAELFAAAKPLASNIILLYNRESLVMERDAAEYLPSPEYGRRADAPMRSLATAYIAIARGGMAPDVQSMDDFDWRGEPGKVIVVPDMRALPERFVEPVKKFVADGGKLVFTGLSGYYDDYMGCRFMDGFPLSEMFGAELGEFKVVGGRQLWDGYLKPAGAATARNSYGKGEALWIPRCIDIGAYHDTRAMKELGEFYFRECVSSALRLRKPVAGVLIRGMKTEDGRIITVIINKNAGRTVIKPAGWPGRPQILNGAKTKIGRRRIRLSADSCTVVVWG